MTQRSSITHHRRRDVLGVHSLDHFAMAVPDVDEARRFYSTFGLAVHEEGSGLSLFAAGDSHRWARLHEGPSKQLTHVSFAAFADDLPRFAARLAERGIARLDPPAGTESPGLWFLDCNGLRIHVVASDVVPRHLDPLVPAPLVPGERSAPFRELMAPTQPLRLAHVMIFVRDVPKSIAFYRDVLGLRLSDEVDGRVAFMHAVHGSDHHVLALLHSDAPGLHHCSWDVGSFEAIGAGAMHMAQAGYREGWGLGRFVLGSNYFHYVRDPWGSYSEYVSHLDYIPSGMDWEGVSHSGPRAFYLWGPEPPKDFSVNHEHHP